MTNKDEYTVREHYVPKFYLKKFSTNKKQLYQLDISNNSPPKPVSINSIAYEIDTYELKDSDGEYIKRNLLEKHLSGLEGISSKYYKSIEAKAFNHQNLTCHSFLTTEEKAILIFFTALMYTRNPQTINLAKETANECFGKELSSNTCDNIAILSCLPIYKKFNENDKSLLMMLIDKYFSNKAFHIYVSTNACFWTSDFPVILFGDNNCNRVDAIYFPLSSRLALELIDIDSLDDTTCKNILIEADAKYIFERNLNIASNCVRWIYSEKELSEYEIKRARKAKHSHIIK